MRHAPAGVQLPTRQAREAYLIVGRRGGKVFYLRVW